MCTMCFALLRSSSRFTNKKSPEIKFKTEFGATIRFYDDDTIAGKKNSALKMHPLSLRTLFLNIDTPIDVVITIDKSLNRKNFLV